MGDEAESNLEMRSSADEAWYDGTVSVSPESRDLIVVHFNDFGEDEDETFHRSELRDPAKLRLRVRVRSVQLQDSQCNRVYLGQKICGCLADGEDRKYYDAEVISITKRGHSFKDDGEECLCKFSVFWLDGPKKKERTVIGCAEVCFLSTEAPEDDPMVKNLLKSLAGHGDQARRKLVKSVPNSVSKSGPKAVPKSVPSPRPRTPSPSLELALSKKQPSIEHSPPTTQKEFELARTKSWPIGSKKKRIMQAEEQLTDLASDNDKLVMDGKGFSATKADSGHEGSEDATGHGDESRTEGKKGSLQATAKKRLVKGKEKTVNREEVTREDDNPIQADISSRTRTFKERLKFNTKKMVTLVDKDHIIVTQTLAERVKLKTAKMAAPDVVVAAATVTVRDEPIKQDVIVQLSLAERVKLKTARKSPAASPVEVHKDSLQKIGKQVVRKRIIKRKLIQLDDPAPDLLRSKFDKVVKPRTMSKPKEVAAKPEEVAVEPNNVESDEPKVQKRKAGRPRKHPLPEPGKPETATTITKEQQVVEIPSEQKQSPREEEILENTTKKRPRDEERSQHDSDDIVSNKSSQSEEETMDAHVRKQANKGTKKKPIIGDHNDILPNDDTVSDKSIRTNDMAEDHEYHSPHVDEANEMSCHMDRNKISIAEKFRDIQNKYHNGSNFSSPQAAQELISLAGSDHYLFHPTEETSHQHFRVSSPHDNSGSHLKTGDENGAYGTSRRVGKRQLVMTDDEMEDVVVTERKQDDFDAVDMCSPMSDPKNTCSVLDEELVGVEKRDGSVVETRLLLLENMETDVSALDVMELLKSNTEGVCAVHVLPVLEFQVSATGYALYRDCGSALMALRWLTSLSRFVVSPKGRPWIVSQAREVYGPSLCGFAAHTAYKSDDPAMCGIISDQPHAHDLVVVTKWDNNAYFQAQQMSKTYEEHKKWQKNLYEQIVQHEKKC